MDNEGEGVEVAKTLLGIFFVQLPIYEMFLLLFI
jgi:hypothetical protein